MFYKCNHFQPYELVDKAIYEKYRGEIWFLFRQDALISLDGIREYFNKPVTVNDWFWGGQFKDSGFRSIHCTTGADDSQHRFGNGFDGKIKGVSAEEARQEIIKNKDHPLLAKITCLETGVSWVHFDCRNIADRILLVKP